MPCASQQTWINRRSTAGAASTRLYSPRRNCGIARPTPLVVFALILLVLFVGRSDAQDQQDVEKGWKWITPLETKRTDIEKAFGESITEDKMAPFQTYVSSFGKINIAFAIETEYLKEYSCIVEKGTVLSHFISPRIRFELSNLSYDLTKFKKDETYSPREISYFSETEGILIDTEIVELPDKTKIERVRAIEYRPKRKPAEAHRK